MLRVGGPYKGRFDSQARAKIREGKRIGMMWVSDEVLVECHVCNRAFARPILDPIENDAWGECPHCHTEFVFAKA